MTVSTILLIILILVLIGALPSWGYSRGWGYGPSGIIGVIVVILLINLLLLVVGMFMETIAALIILFVPLLGLATSVGIDPLHFATFAVLNLMIGLTTPPIGVCLFVACNIAREPLAKVVVAVIPFLISNLIVLLLVSYYPPFATWLPNTLMGN